MADGFKIEISGDAALELAAAAKARGMSVEDYGRAMLQLGHDSQSLGADLDVAEDMAAFEDYERTGMGVPWEEVSAWMSSLTTPNPLPKPAPRKLK